MAFMYRYPPYRSGQEKVSQSIEHKVIDTKGLPAQVLESFNLEPANIEEIKGSWVLDIPGNKCWVRLFPGEPGPLVEALQWQNYLFDQGCRALLPIKKDKNGKYVLTLGRNNYCVTAWPLSGEEFCGTNPLHLMAVAREMGRIHHISSQYRVSSVSPCLSNWAMIIQNKLTELLDFYHHIKKQGSKNDFEGIFLENFDFLYDQGQEAIENIVMAGCAKGCGERQIILINNFLPENMMLEEAKILFKELGFGPAGSNILDLAMFFNSYLALHHWDLELVLELLKGYQESEPLDYQGKRILLSQLRFPGRFWLYTYQYSQGEKSLGELTEKLRSYIRECYCRDKCLDSMENQFGGSEQDEYK